MRGGGRANELRGFSMVNHSSVAANAAMVTEQLAPLDADELFAGLGVAIADQEHGSSLRSLADSFLLGEAAGGQVLDAMRAAPAPDLDFTGDVMAESLSPTQRGKAFYEDFMRQFGRQLRENFCDWYEQNSDTEDNDVVKVIVNKATEVLGLSAGAAVVIGGVTISAAAAGLVALVLASIAWLLVKTGLDLFCVKATPSPGMED